MTRLDVVLAPALGATCSVLESSSEQGSMARFLVRQAEGHH